MMKKYFLRYLLRDWFGWGTVFNGRKGSWLWQRVSLLSLCCIFSLQIVAQIKRETSDTVAGTSSDSLDVRRDLGIGGFTIKQDGGKDGEITLAFTTRGSSKIYTHLVSVRAPASAKSITIPKQIKRVLSSGEEEYHTIIGIDSEAFKGTHFEEVVIKADLQSIGSRAFLTSTNKTETASTIKRVIFTTDAPPPIVDYARLEDEPGEFQRPFAPHQKIHVKKSKVNAFKSGTNWGAFRNQISYTIEGRAVRHKYVTFCCDFDVDFNFGNTSDLPGNVAVNKNFVFFIGHPMQLKYGNGDYGSRRTPYKLHLNRLPNNMLSGGAGILVQNTGKSTTEKFYYRVSETQGVPGYTNVDLPGSLLATNRFNQAYVERFSQTYEHYVLQEGVFRKIPKSLQKFGVNYQTCYLITYLPTATNAPEEIGFMEEDTTTGVSTLTTREGEEVTYDLRGLRSSPSPRGSLVIKKGKKLFTK